MKNGFSLSLLLLVLTAPLIAEEDMAYLEAFSVIREDANASVPLSPKEIKHLEQKFLHKEITEKLLEDLKDAVLYCLQDKGEFTAIVSFPDQDITEGTVTLQISSSKVESVEVRGNRWQSADFYRDRLALSPGESLDTSQLLNRLAWLNRNPFYYAEIVVGPGQQADSVDVDFLVKDRWMFRPFFEADNTGTNLTGEVRLCAGANWGKPFGRSDLLTYQYTTAPDPHKFYAHTGSYTLFLPWKHELTFFGGYSAAHPDLGPSFSQEGRSTQASMRYGIPFQPLYHSPHQTFTWGFDYKNFNSNVFFIDSTPAIPVVTHQVNLSQFYLSYTREDQFLVKCELLFSPFHWLPNQSNARYDSLRPDSSVYYLYGRIALSDIHGKPENVSFAWILRAQGATGPLLPSEQFGLGGYDTVRGYQERDFLSDNALCANAELRAPKISFFRRDALVFLAFSDFGYGANFDSELGSQKSQYLWSAGAGLRYQIAPYFSVRADYGMQIHHIFGKSSLGRFHLGGSLSY